MSEPGDPLAEFVGGDAEGARSLRRALESLRGSDIQPSLSARVTAVLDGRMAMRDLAHEPALREIAERGLERLREQIDEMSTSERAELVRRSAARAAESDPDQRESPREPVDP